MCQLWQDYKNSHTRTTHAIHGRTCPFISYPRCLPAYLTACLPGCRFAGLPIWFAPLLAYPVSRKFFNAYANFAVKFCVQLVDFLTRNFDCTPCTTVKPAPGVELSIVAFGAKALKRLIAIWLWEPPAVAVSVETSKVRGGCTGRGRGLIVL